MHLKNSFLATQYISVKGIHSRYAISGEGEVILFLHGFPENLQTWRFYPAYLSDKFRLVVFDLKGFGYSDKPAGDYSPEGMAEFVKDFMDTLNIGSVYLVGTDIGLTIACAFALKYPQKVKKLILMAGTVHAEEIIAPEINLLSTKLLGEFILFFFGAFAIKVGLKKGFHNKRSLSRSLFEEYYNPYRESVARKRTLELLRSFNAHVPFLAKEIHKISIPTLIIWAQYESFFSLRAAHRLRQDIKNSQLEIIPDCGHFIQEEKPQESASMIASFIQHH